MPVCRLKQHRSSSTRPVDPCSHTREVTDVFVALFYFSATTRKITCHKQRQRTSAIRGASLLRLSRPT
jgi:hypothetical protein